MSPKNSRLVYSTETGRIKPKDTPEAPFSKPSTDGIVRLERESKGRSGKGVTLVKGLGLEEGPLKKLAKELKQLCGTGGTVKNGVIEIQGEQRQKLRPYLEDKGFSVKIAGG